MHQKYDVVVTNPPYMGSSGMGGKLSQFVKDFYPDSKSDMSTVCMEKAMTMCKPNGYMAMINIPVWMFLSSYEKLRQKLLGHNEIVNMVHPGRGIFGSDFGTTTFVFKKMHIAGYKGSYRRLFDAQGEVKSNEERESALLAGKGCYTAQQDNFAKIPGSPVAYWAKKQVFEAYDWDRVSDHYTVRNGISTGDNEKYLRLWFEVDFTCDYWKPCHKGGSFRKWYGNNDYVIYWDDNGRAIRTALDDKGRVKARLGGIEFSFFKAIEMTRVTSGVLGFRYSEGGFVYESSTNDVYEYEHSYTLKCLLGYLNSSVVQMVLNILNPTINVMPEDIRSLPCPIIDSKDEINGFVEENITISRSDWDSYETSWDFQRHPLI